MSVLKERFLADATRVALLVLAATACLAFDERLALLAGFPSLGPWMMFAGLSLYGAALAHVLLRIYFPYVDGRPLVAKARETSVGAAIVFLTRGIVLAALLLTLPTLVKAAEPPQRARQYLPILKDEQQRLWPDMPMPAVLGAQVEQETCITLTHRMCWSPRAELRTSRERGVGLGQITKTTRFDALSELSASTGSELRGWSWGDDSIYDPRYQLRGLVLKDLQVWRAFSRYADTPLDGVSFMLAGYNGGIGGVMSDRKLCGSTPACDSGRWAGHVEHTSLKAKRATSGYGKSFFEINREYVRNVTGLRLGRYQGLL